MAFEYWYWFLIAGILFLFELSTLLIFFLFFGIAALLMGVIMFFVKDLNGNSQLMLAGVFSILALVAGYYVFKARTTANNTDDCNNRMREQIGKAVTLLKDTENNFSKIKLGDTYWRILIQDGKKGDWVTITDFSSTHFIGKSYKEKS